MSPAPTISTRALTIEWSVRGDQRPASCSRVKCGIPRWAASIAATAHSAVEGVCAPRALHSHTPSGIRPTNFSAPALISCTSRSSGRASSTPSGSAPPPRGTSTWARAASPVGGPSAGS
jgi:hypothetical protein